MTVLAATAWPTNADMILDVVKLGYLKHSDRVLDPTFGYGGWWTKWEPTRLVATDLVTAGGIDFRNMPWQDNSFDVVAYDPPYVSVGGRATSGMQEMYARYGQLDAPRTPAELQRLINAGLSECERVTRKYVLVKCQDYISSGKLWLGTYFTMKHAIEGLGMEVVDRLEHTAKAPRPQPPGRRQVHARRNLSTLLVLKKRS